MEAQDVIRLVRQPVDTQPVIAQRRIDIDRLDALQVFRLQHLNQDIRPAAVRVVRQDAAVVIHDLEVQKLDKVGGHESVSEFYIRVLAQRGNFNRGTADICDVLRLGVALLREKAQRAVICGMGLERHQRGRFRLPGQSRDRSAQIQCEPAPVGAGGAVQDKVPHRRRRNALTGFRIDARRQRVRVEQRNGYAAADPVDQDRDFQVYSVKRRIRRVLDRG